MGRVNTKVRFPLHIYSDASFFNTFDDATLSLYKHKQVGAFDMLYRAIESNGTR